MPADVDHWYAPRDLLDNLDNHCKALPVTLALFQHQLALDQLVTVSGKIHRLVLVLDIENLIAQVLLIELDRLGRLLSPRQLRLSQARLGSSCPLNRCGFFGWQWHKLSFLREPQRMLRSLRGDQSYLIQAT